MGMIIATLMFIVGYIGVTVLVSLEIQNLYLLISFILMQVFVFYLTVMTGKKINEQQQALMLFEIGRLQRLRETYSKFKKKTENEVNRNNLN